MLINLVEYWGLIIALGGIVLTLPSEPDVNKILDSKGDTRILGANTEKWYIWDLNQKIGKWIALIGGSLALFSFLIRVLFT